ncbi:DUF1481 domain-containing protein [Photobacterium leiognathi]|uniref:DUF1481 domain-containing protein n=1 Tax=Photobacterium leiognathi TaxID=553611 RepID=UPI0005D35EEA|nr:DUF1481 domain-containing protein [Photobacterium leiognathi]KJF88067.1 hypothetical protein UB42_16730 [Photobacterium leiognathi]
MSRVSSLLIFLLPFALSGCIASNLADKTVLPITTINVAEHSADTTTVYWYSSRQNQPERLGECIYTEKQGYYQSDYQWQSGKLRTLLQRGTKRVDGQLVPFSLQLRFDSQGLAVFQRYKEADHVLPVTMSEIAILKQRSDLLRQRIARLDRKQQHFVQGYWQQQQLMSCTTHQPLRVSEPALLASSAPNGYWAAIGKESQGQLTVQQVLSQIHGHSCLYAPKLIELAD